MFTVIAYAMLLMTLISVILAAMGRYWLYWIAALSIYIFSFLAGFSIGQLTVGLTFVFITLAAAHSFNLIHNSLHYMVFLLLGVIIGALLIVLVRSWLFWPFWIFMN
ncbi:hypothetical protein [Lentibacillus amyloliquefaciens]|uniref:Major facilitator superfamily (MFS) profile domain-containing protein n=1 Tax=Lentibacillus amyloliquefaciens TaxID=1472767 RepID=A0A0U4F7W9_9BACI|nr:hypothetical protein [Lentibacillus amyloliquefaciens]ALX48883.1 hypothetical protein AOX59_09815 [Lentibacillus amyloliquefaciens]